jgi:hypothetical protein
MPPASVEGELAEAKTSTTASPDPDMSDDKSGELPCCPEGYTYTMPRGWFGSKICVGPADEVVEPIACGPDDEAFDPAATTPPPSEEPEAPSVSTRPPPPPSVVDSESMSVSTMNIQVQAFLLLVLRTL